MLDHIHNYVPNIVDANLNPPLATLILAAKKVRNTMTTFNNFDGSPCETSSTVHRL